MNNDVEIMIITIVGAALVLQIVFGRMSGLSTLGKCWAWMPGPKVMMPICSCCKRVRTTGGDWVVIDIFPHQAAGATFSYTYCPLCEQRCLEEMEGYST